MKIDTNTAKMNYPPVLDRLAKMLPKPLYIVGGAVRDFIMGLDYFDIDLAAALAPDAVLAALQGSEFSARIVNKKLGTLCICAEGNTFEYTCFRTDSYTDEGRHLPIEVAFTDDLTADAYRRDLRPNAIYYDLCAGKFIDPTGGIADIEAGVFGTTRAPESVFAEDALRMLRVVRQTTSLGVRLCPKVKKSIQKCASLVMAISAERIRDELEKMIVADTKYGISDAHYEAFVQLIELGLVDYIIPELLECRGVAQRADYHKYDVLTHIVQTFRAAVPAVRLAAIFHDIAKPSQKRLTGSMAGHDLAGAVVTRYRLRQLKFPNVVIEQTARLVENHMLDLKCEMSERKLRKAIQKNHDIIDLIAALKDADSKGSGMGRKGDSAARLRAVRDAMIAEGRPFVVKDLQVSGEDLLDIAPELRSTVLNDLLAAAAYEKNLATRDDQLNFVKRWTKNRD